MASARATVLRWTGVVALAVVAGLAAGLLWPQRYELTFTAGHPLGRRHQVAMALAESAAQEGVTLRLVPSSGSMDAIAMVADGTIDGALIQGGLAAPPVVRQVSAMYPEPLHLLVRQEIAAGGLAALAGRRVNLGPEGSGTRELATMVLELARLHDVEPTGLDYAALETLPAESLPDGVFMVQSMPSDVAAFLVSERGYRLLGMPFAASLAYRDVRLHEATIPAMMYSLDPPVPPVPLPAIGTALLVVAREDIPAAAVDRLLRAIWERDLGRAANLPDLGSRPLVGPPELPLHDGAERFARRRNPMLRAELVESVENARSFLVSTAVALVLLWRWAVRRRSERFDRFMDEVTAIERRAMELELSDGRALDELVGLRNRLSALKADALERFTFGKLRGEELMTGFLSHVADVRSYLNALIQHERDRTA